MTPDASLPPPTMDRTDEDRAEQTREQAAAAIRSGRVECGTCGDLIVQGAFPSMLAAFQAHRALVCR